MEKLATRRTSEKRRAGRPAPIAKSPEKDSGADHGGTGWTTSPLCRRGVEWWTSARRYTQCSGWVPAGGWDLPESWSTEHGGPRPIGEYKRRRGEEMEERAWEEDRQRLPPAGSSRAEFREGGEEKQRETQRREEGPGQKIGQTPHRKESQTRTQKGEGGSLAAHGAGPDPLARRAGH